MICLSPLTSSQVVSKISQFFWLAVVSWDAFVGKRLRYALVLGVAILAVCVGGIFWAYLATQQVPAFYVAVGNITPSVQAAAGDELERRILSLRNDFQADGFWEATFTEEQLNGWLASDLPEKFGDVLPDGVSDPRISIRDQRLQIACRVENPKFETVVSLSVDLNLTQETNVLAISVRDARAGKLPIPLKGFLDDITNASLEAEIDIRWVHDAGMPVALVPILIQQDKFSANSICLNKIEVRHGEIYLAGRTLSQDQ